MIRSLIRNNLRTVVFFAILTLNIGIGLFLHADCLLFFNKGIFMALVYCGLVIGWVLTAANRVQNARNRRLVLLMGVFMVVFLLLRVIRYQYLADTVYSRYLWYMYYIPETMLPLLVFYVSLQIGNNDRPFINRWLLMLIPSIAISVGILTNDLHQLAFRFDAGFDGPKHRGILYIIAFCWMLLLSITAILISYRKSRLEDRRSRTLLLLLWMLLPLAYLLYYITGPYFAETYILQFAEALSLFYIGYFDLCIRLGLIPSNTHHRELISAGSVSAQIVGTDGKVVFQSAHAPALSPALRSRALRGSFRLPDYEHMLHGRSIRGGYVFWTTDIADLVAMNEELSEIREQLAEENSLIAEENKALVRRAALREQNLLYSEIDRLLSPKTHYIDSLLDGIAPDAPEYKHRLQLVCIYAAYIKRRSNLAILKKTNETINLAEVCLSIRESVNMLRQYGAVCNIGTAVDLPLSADTAIALYDCFEDILESALPDLTALMCTVTTCAGQADIRLELEDVTSIPETDVLNVRYPSLCVTADPSDDTLYLVLSTKQEV